MLLLIGLLMGAVDVREMNSLLAALSGGGGGGGGKRRG